MLYYVNADDVGVTCMAYAVTDDDVNIATAAVLP